jgi:hypothetical protein
MRIDIERIDSREAGREPDDEVGKEGKRVSKQNSMSLSSKYDIRKNFQGVMAL